MPSSDAKTPSQPQSHAPTTSNEPYNTLLRTLLTHAHPFYSPPRILIPQSSSLSSPSSLPTISSLSLHPTLESALHILNGDLASAHFLLRHAQAAPAYESMYLHGILHRVEGDVDNARAWYGFVLEADVFTAVWGDDGGEKWKGFLDRVQAWRERSGPRKGSGNGEREGGKGGKGVDWVVEERELRRESLDELIGVLRFCEKKFGVGKVEDATSEYTMNGEKTSDIASKMIIGGEGWREF